MPMSSREYRQHLYDQRTHPQHLDKSRNGVDSFIPLYLSVAPFIFAEYWAELRYDTLPSGLVFPTAFLLFWAFYYTYYQPGFLESRLTNPSKWDLFAFPTILMGITIWFVKVVVVEFTDVIVGHLTRKKKPVQKPHAAPPPPRQENYQAPRPKPSGLPREIENALHILGLRECREWRLVQKRYRELAKKFHPDLNPELTTSGNRFMIYDAAYRRLEQVKEKYFH